MGGLIFLGCATPGPRPYYHRNSGDYGPWELPATFSLTRPAGVVAAGIAETDRLREVAESYLGVRYRFGGQSRKGMDCSGFVRQVFKQAMDIDLPHHSAAMARHGEAVDRSDLRPGDIVLFKDFFYITHSGIYMGDGWFIHSQTSRGVVYTRLDAPYFGSHFAEARRVYLSNS